MKKAWIDGVEQDMVEEVKASFIRSHDTRMRLIDILEKRLQRLDEVKTNKDYDCPNWNLKQADYIGSARVYQEVISLLKDEK